MNANYINNLLKLKIMAKALDKKKIFIRFEIRGSKITDLFI